MTKRSVLYLLEPTAFTSPFDINMAIDAGYDVVLPYAGVRLENVVGLAQDAIFSRGDDGVRHTGLFIGGRDIGLALDMLEAAEKAMVPPFQVSVMADPSGGFTTSAAAVALAEKQLREKHGLDFRGLKTVVFGGTGPVGLATAILAARCGAEVTIVDHASIETALEKAEVYGKRAGVSLTGTQAISDADKAYLLHHAHVVFCTAKAGVQVLNREVLAEAARLKIAIDVNAVPPLGIEGVKRTDNAAPLKYATNSPDAVGTGALRVGGFKNRLQHTLLKWLLKFEEPVFVDFLFAYKIARDLEAEDEKQKR
jgi:methylene-tetrahydromethanopterin dehydrogenase